MASDDRTGHGFGLSCSRRRACKYVSYRASITASDKACRRGFGSGSNIVSGSGSGSSSGSGTGSSTLGCSPDRN